jgi:hypothetical protein
MFSFQQGVSGETVHFIADSCQHLKNLTLDGVANFFYGAVIRVINRLGKHLTTLGLDEIELTDVAYLHLKNCST